MIGSPQKADRIAIVGAGVGGLSAAHYLKRQGYSNVDVIEKSAAVGGKVQTINHSEDKYELGAVLIPRKYIHLKELLGEFEVELAPIKSRYYYKVKDEKKKDLLRLMLFENGAAESLRQINRLKNLARQYAHIEEPGFGRVPKELMLPFSEFTLNRGINGLLKPLSSMLTGTGYGFTDVVPAVYLAKFFSMIMDIGICEIKSNISSHWSTPYYTTKGNLQEIWHKIAAKQNMIYNAEVNKITRNSQGIELSINEKSHQYDWCLMATDCQTTQNILELSDDEKAVFAKVETYRYIVSLIEAEGIEKGRSIFVEHNCHSSKINHVSSCLNRKDAAYVTTYQVCDYETPIEELAQIAEDDLKSLGARSCREVEKKIWNQYFPHYKTQALDEQPYEKLESLQGQNRTFYVGGLPSFETMETICSYSKETVRRYFK